ncbi:hypothetical protein [Lacrimispora sp.]|uniref:hypothetical protein n=1 Tax=Lacrimispora sp. TaxID=2719234 RepID=UPI002899A7DB|nr:hypothetical protein [Lacrimispora sp.]
MIQEKSNVELTEAIKFALIELHKAESYLKGGPSVTLKLDMDAKIPPQGYRLNLTGNMLFLTGGDEAGIMYGILDLAKHISRKKSIEGIGFSEVIPYLLNRGIKFNIPLDARTPSYSDSSDSASHNIKDMWDFMFWTDFLDRMALNKYNVLSLWTLSPFPSMVRIPEYPLTALEDVKRTTRPFKAELSGWGIYAPDMENSLVTVKKITMDEKINFWQSVMEYAKNRCIKIYIFTWNLFTYGTEKSPYGITSEQDNPVTKDYIYCGTKALLRTYPLLAGIGVTAGEHMTGDETDVPFLAETYGRGVKEVLTEQRDRDFRFIHRMQMTRYDSIMAEFEDFPCPIEISFKYSQAHMYSNTKPAFITDFLEEKKPDINIWLTLRNDDFYMYRWGNPEFAREYLSRMPVDTMTGYYMGADGFTWGRDYMDKRDMTHPLFMDKMWYMYFIWGQLSYNINLNESYFINELKTHFNTEEEALLYEIWKHVSDIIPEVNCTHWHDFDFQWYPEGCCMYEPETDKLVFADINEFVACKSVPGGEYISVVDYCSGVVKEETIEGINPLSMADSIWNHADKAMKGLIEIKRNTGIDRELKVTLDDIESLSYLGFYYSLKIKGAVSLCMYRLTGRKILKEEAASLLSAASEYWKKYSVKSGNMYKPQVLTRLCGCVDVQKFDELTELDVLLALED